MRLGFGITHGYFSFCGKDGIYNLIIGEKMAWVAVDILRSGSSQTLPHKSHIHTNLYLHF